MTNRTYGTTASGTPIADRLIEKLATRPRLATTPR